MVKQEIKSFTLDIGEHHGLGASAPCSILSVLSENKVIGDVYVGDNSETAKKYAGRTAMFTAEFEVSSVMMSMKNVFLSLSGLDTLCKIELNGKEIARTDNMHRAYFLDAKTKLAVGKNIMKLTFYPTSDGDAVRKSRYLFGTATAPSLCDGGIFRKIELVGFNHKIIGNVRISESYSGRSLRLDLTLETLGYDEMSRAVATLVSPAENVYFCGFMNGKGVIDMNDANLWWTNGIGMQNLYHMSVNLYSESVSEDTLDKYIGFRTVKHEKDDTGRHCFLLNGTELQLFGACFAPEDILHGRSIASRTEELVEVARASGMNALFISSDGYYPDEHFLSSCDRAGILVFVDVPRSPITSDMKDNIREEINSNLRRMSYHPSFAALTGNSELAELFSDESDRASLTDGALNYDGAFIFDIDGSMKAGLANISYISMPTYDSVKKFIPIDARNLGSYDFELHGASEASVMSMLSSAYELYPYASSLNELSYIMGLSAAEKTRVAVENVMKLSRKDRPFGIILGQMNDSWGTLSPSSVDYYGGRKPLSYREREFFSHIQLMTERNGTRVKFKLVNSTNSEYDGTFEYSVCDNENKPVFKDSFKIKAAAYSDMDVHNIDLGSVITGHMNEYYLKYRVSGDKAGSHAGILLFTKPKRFKHRKPSFAVDITGSKRDFVLKVGADCFVRGVEVSFSEVEAELDENFFDITSAAPVKVNVRTKGIVTVEKLKRTLNIRSIYDLGKE